MWNLRKYLEQEFGITTAVQLQAYIEATVGIILAVQTLRSLLRNPVAPRKEMLQLLCDVFNCRSDAFYLITPNPERARQWERDRLEGKKPSGLYKRKALVEEVMISHSDSVDNMAKLKSLRATFSDPRIFFKRKSAGRSNEVAAS